MKDFKKIVKNFPKKKTKLSKEYLKIYDEHYKNNRDGKGLFNFLSNFLERWAHKIVKKKNNKGKKILEIGAGTLNHLKYEKNYKTYDIVEPYKKLYLGSIYKKKISNFYTSIFNINKKYDRIISIMTLEHITNLPAVIKKTFKLLDKKGIFQIAIPCEGEKAFELAWKMTTGLAFRMKYGLDYSIIMRHEHVNTKEEIEIILKKFFKIVKFKRSPFFLPIRNFSFYCYFECKKII